MNLKPFVLTLGVSLLATIASGVTMTHSDKGLLANTKETRCGELSSFCLDPKENILACDAKAKCIKVISQEDKLLAQWPMNFMPQVITCRPDSTIVVAGAGRVALLDATGKTLISTNLPAPSMPSLNGKKMSKAERDSIVSYMCSATAVTSMGDDIFVCARGNTGNSVYRLDSKLENRTIVIKGLSGCCGQMDLTAKGDKIYVANNGESKVVTYDRDGKKLGAFGKDKANRDSYFNGCCEPKNVCIGPDGSVYAAESAQCCINRFSPEGTLLDRVGVVKGITGCVRVTVALTHDTNRIFMLDTDHNTIHVLARSNASR